jgi:BioD-like phosphotransacetylase family protein
VTKKSVYIAATSQHVGKTTMTLGLLAALKNRGIDVGYCKPLGQQYLTVKEKRVDKDAVLFASAMPFDLEPDIHSPVILGPGDTAAYLDDPSPDMFHEVIRNAAEIMHQRHEVVVFEGTGHPGVGSVVDLSNAQVAKDLHAGVILILEGGIGNTLDILTLCQAVFKEQGVEIYGVIINKVIPAKMEKVRHYLRIGLAERGIELLGMIPFDEELVYPQMRHVVKAVRGQVVTGAQHMDNLIYDTIAGTAMDFDPEMDPATLLMVVSVRRLNSALAGLEKNCEEFDLEHGLGGLLVTGHYPMTEGQTKKVIAMDIPVAKTSLDTYDAAVKLGHLVAKIDTQNPQKISRAKELFRRHADIERICELIDAHAYEKVGL